MHIQHNPAQNSQNQILGNHIFSPYRFWSQELCVPIASARTAPHFSVWILTGSCARKSAFVRPLRNAAAAVKMLLLPPQPPTPHLLPLKFQHLPSSAWNRIWLILFLLPLDANAKILPVKYPIFFFLSVVAFIPMSGCFARPMLRLKRV